ncbi:MAG TPA: YpmS family protein [Bacillota bacterium]|nr:YpmS family protein [Bacillota bacterium]
MSERKTSNQKWKRRFYSIIVVDIAVLMVILLLIFWPVEGRDIQPRTDVTEEESSEFVVRTTKENLNDLVNAYLDQLLKHSKHRYSIDLDDDVHLQGELPVFSTTVPLSVRLEPFVQDNGDIVLKQKSMSIGLLPLPNRKIMEYIDQYLPMPPWVTVDPKNEEIYVAVTDMNIKSNFHIRVEHIDLEANHLAFKIKVPYQTLGID